MNAQAIPFLPFQSTKVRRLGIRRAAAPASYSSMSISRGLPVARSSCDVSARDCRFSQLQAGWQAWKKSSASTMESCSRSRLREAKVAPSWGFTIREGSVWNGQMPCNWVLVSAVANLPLKSSKIDALFRVRGRQFWTNHRNSVTQMLELNV